jgi:hypothetical protein
MYAQAEKPKENKSGSSGGAFAQKQSEGKFVSKFRNDGQQPIQLAAAWKPDNHPNDTLDGFANKLNQLVAKGAKIALESPADLPGEDGYTTLWKDSAQIMAAIRARTLLNNTDETRAVISFAAARYGYAIEAYASSMTGDLQAALPQGYSFQLQASRGMTRPDIVVFNNNGVEVGWFDITSSASLGHIDKKTGAGWKNKPYVAEITYDPMDLAQLNTGGLSPAEGVVLRNTLGLWQQAWDTFVTGKKDHFSVLYRGLVLGPIPTSKEGKRDRAKDVLNIVFSPVYVTDGVAKSLLRSLDLNIRDFGFKDGGTKAAGDHILREMHAE